MAAFALLGMSACVDGRDPTGLETHVSMGLPVHPTFSVLPTKAEVALLDRARIVAFDLESGETMGSLEQEIDPSAAEWVFDLTLRIPSVKTRQMVVTVELISDIVEWSGQAPPVPVAIGAEPAELRVVRLLRGPLDNVGVTAVEVTQGPDSLSEGASGHFGVSLMGGGSHARAFFRSLSPDVLEVSREGAFRGLQPGDVRVEARAGAVADTILVSVLSQPLDGEDAQAISGGVEDSVDRLVPGLQDGPGAQAIVASLTDFEAALASRRPARIQDAIAAARAALAAYGTPEIRYQDGPELSLIELVLDYTERVILAGIAAFSDN